MVKDSKRYAATGGWGFGRFIGGKPVDEAQHRTCFACHQARVKGHDYVFTRYAPYRRRRGSRLERHTAPPCQDILSWHYVG